MALPFLPGNTFRDPTRSNYARSHTLKYKNNYQATETLVPPASARTLSDAELEACSGVDPGM